MIFYFTGTGNSLWVAEQLHKVFDGELISVADELKNDSDSFTYKLTGDEKVFLVFPVHSWGPAILISRFIEKLSLINYHNQPVYVVCTCGDECGYTDRIVTRQLEKSFIRLTGIYSLQMPNNYILMKGFGIDSEEIERTKLEAASEAIYEIIASIRSGKEKKRIYRTGTIPWLKSRLIYPAFSRFAIGKNSFYATEKCIGCGLCAEICPTNTIMLNEDKFPVWDNSCVQCTACIHRCPVKAIEYGKITQNQGRYVHPVLRRK